MLEIGIAVKRRIKFLIAIQITASRLRELRRGNMGKARAMDQAGSEINAMLYDDGVSSAFLVTAIELPVWRSSRRNQQTA